MSRLIILIKLIKQMLEKEFGNKLVLICAKLGIDKGSLKLLEVAVRMLMKVKTVGRHTPT